MKDLVDLPVGAVVEFEYNLVAHPDTWCYYKGIVLKKTERNVKVWCLRNEHIGVFSLKCGKHRKIKVLNGEN